MNVLRNDYPGRGMERVCRYRDLKTVHWYVLTLPTAAGGRHDRISPPKGLDAESSCRECRGETLLEYFAPSYAEMRKMDDKLVNTRRPLLFSYVFIRSLVEEIFRMRQTSPLYNSLPRISSGGTPYFPYLSDSKMGNLRQVAELYSNEPPVHVPDSSHLLKGDRICITSGYLAGMEAEMVIQPGGGHEDVVARTLDYVWVPLLEVKPGGHEPIELDINGKYVYIRLDSDRLRDGLHNVLDHYHASGSIGEEDTRLAHKVLGAYGSLRVKTDVMRYKVYSLLLLAYRLPGEKKEFARLLTTMRDMFLVMKAPQSHALLLITLYGCIDNNPYRQMAHEVVDPWRSESSPRKSRLSLIRRLDGYDQWFNHEIS